jgi:hypothetical protein
MIRLCVDRATEDAADSEWRQFEAAVLYANNVRVPVDSQRHQVCWQQLAQRDRKLALSLA